jgi:hypothetical protein
MSNPLLLRIAKKTPEESKVTKMMTAQGWTLVGGNEVWLTFKKKGVPGEVTVTRGTKEWVYDLPEVGIGDDPTVEGKGLESLLQALPTLGRPKAKGMSAGAAAIATNNAGPAVTTIQSQDEEQFQPNYTRVTGSVPLLCDPTKAPKTSTDGSGHAQMGDEQRVLDYLKANGPKLPQQFEAAFGWTHEQAYSMLEYLRSEGKVGIKQMRYYAKQASRFRLQSKILYRKSKPISVWQQENQQIKEGGPQGDDISRKSDGDYPRMRRSR